MMCQCMDTRNIIIEVADASSGFAPRRLPSRRGPSINSKLPYSAYVTMIFTVFRLDFKPPFIPKDSDLPARWQCWVVNFAIVKMMLRF